MKVALGWVSYGGGRGDQYVNVAVVEAPDVKTALETFLLEQGRETEDEVYWEGNTVTLCYPDGEQKLEVTACEA